MTFRALSSYLEDIKGKKGIHFFLNKYFSSSVVSGRLTILFSKWKEETVFVYH